MIREDMEVIAVVMEVTVEEIVVVMEETVVVMEETVVVMEETVGEIVVVMEETAGEDSVEIATEVVNAALEVSRAKVDSEVNAVYPQDLVVGGNLVQVQLSNVLNVVPPSTMRVMLVLPLMLQTRLKLVVIGLDLVTLFKNVNCLVGNSTLESTLTSTMTFPRKPQVVTLPSPLESFLTLIWIPC